MTAVVLVIGAAIAHADETPREIDPESTDHITLALARLAVETKADEITPEAQGAEEMVTAIENLEQVNSISEFIDEYMVFDR